ncbi:MAG: class I SAM-dependent methyltransferase [Chthoniobacterales bacterium]
MTPSCDFCGCTALETVYEVPDSPKAARVLLCPVCSLLQSEYRSAGPTVKKRSLSSGPDWGNVRHGKGLRLQPNLDFIGKHSEPSGWHRILDVGSNRGHFCRHAVGHGQVKTFTAVEPDVSVAEGYPDLPEVRFHGERFERLALDGETFDFIYCSHTLEHADSAAEMLRTMARLLAPQGHLFVEVPSIGILALTDHLEEFFIDKHTFHFAPETLIAFVRSIGLDVIAQQPDSDRSHVTLLLGHAASPGAAPAFPPPELREVAVRTRASLADYSRHLEANRAKLGSAREKIEFLLSRQSVAFWGAGRQLDSFLRHSGFDPGKVSAIIDEHLSGIIEEVGGAAIQKPDVLRRIQPQVVVAFARNAFPEIAKKVRGYGVKNVIRFTDLLA